MNTQNTYQSLHQTSSSLAARAGRLLGRWMEVSGVHDVVDGFAAGAVSAQLTACEAATGFSGKDGGWELAFHRTIMMDIRGVNS